MKMVNWGPILNMKTATFFCNHIPTKSRAVVEFAADKQRVYIVGVNFVEGKVIDINAVRACSKRAKHLLVSGGA
jgi:hypothetical protein